MEVLCEQYLREDAESFLNPVGWLSCPTSKGCESLTLLKGAITEPSGNKEGKLVDSMMIMIAYWTFTHEITFLSSNNWNVAWVLTCRPIARQLKVIGNSRPTFFHCLTRQIHCISTPVMDVDLHWPCEGTKDVSFFLVCLLQYFYLGLDNLFYCEIKC